MSIDIVPAEQTSATTENMGGFMQAGIQQHDVRGLGGEAELQRLVLNEPRARRGSSRCSTTARYVVRYG